MHHIREGCEYCASFRCRLWLCLNPTEPFFSLSSCLFPCQLRQNNNHALCLPPHVKIPQTQNGCPNKLIKIKSCSHSMWLIFPGSWFCWSWIAVAASQPNSYFIAQCWWSHWLLHWYEICFSISLLAAKVWMQVGKKGSFCVREQLLHRASVLHREM